jgi:hypothetical protein
MKGEKRVNWQKQIADAQLLTTYELVGKEYVRIPYGSESEEAAAAAHRGPCHDCEVAEGQLHVPGCDSEACPRCFQQAISCSCHSSPSEALTVGEQ